MPVKELTAAYNGLEALLADVKKMEMAGKHEGMKNSFLGGMRDGESWGLRKWLSTHGGAMHICNDIELIWGGLRNLEKTDPMTIELAKRVRPKVKQANDRLKTDVPKAYQEVSSAHPYLPFFHRLESALKGLSEFDPEDDDVICLDDDSDEEEAKPAASSTTSSAVFGNGSTGTEGNASFQAAAYTNETSSFRFSNDGADSSDDDSDIEFVGVKGPPAAAMKTDPESPIQNASLHGQRQKSSSKQSSSPNPAEWRCPLCTYQNGASLNRCDMCDYEAPDDSDDDDGEKCSPHSSHWDRATPQQFAEALDSIATALEEGREVRPAECINASDFWSHPSSNYVMLLRLFQEMLLTRTSQYLMDPVALCKKIEEDLTRYYSMLRNPLGFRDIVVALAEADSSETPGRLETSTLSKWNMFEGKCLIQAVDLVLLNTLAFIGKDTTPLRKEIQNMRKKFWKEIRGVGCSDKKQIPPRRTENSDFLLFRKAK